MYGRTWVRLYMGDGGPPPLMHERVNDSQQHSKIKPVSGQFSLHSLMQDPVVAAKLMRFTLMAPLARLPAHVLLLILRVNILLWVGESCSHMCSWEVQSQV